MNKLGLFAFNFLYYGSAAFYLPFLVKFYESLNFTGLEIGILTAAGPLILLLSTPLFTNIADTTGKHRYIMSSCFAISLILVALIPTGNNFVMLLLLILALNIFLGPVVPFVDSATLHMLGDEKAMYGRVRLGGTIGWAVCASIAGLVSDNFGLKVSFWTAAGFLLLPFLMSLRFSFPNTRRKNEESGSVLSLLTNPLWIRFLLMAFLGGITFAVSNNQFFSYMTELGASESLMGMALTIGTIMEIPVLYFGNRLLGKFRASHLLVIAVLIGGFRLLSFGLVDNLTLVMLIQPLSGLSFTVLWLAGVAYANDHAPENLTSTAQGLFSTTVFGVGSASGGILGGLMMEQMSVQNMYLLIGAGIMLAPLLITAIWRFVPEPKLKNA